MHLLLGRALVMHGYAKDDPRVFHASSRQAVGHEDGPRTEGLVIMVANS